MKIKISTTKIERHAMFNKHIIFTTIFFLTAGNAIRPQYPSVVITPKSAFQETSLKSPEPGTVFLYPEHIKLKKGGFFNAERGWIFVPENRSKRNSNIIAIEVYRFKRSNKANPETPPIFYLHGGPSFQGLESNLKKLGSFEEWWMPMLDISDVVIVSQRGIGPSKPTTIIEMTMKPLSLDQPYDDGKATREFRRTLAREKAVWDSLGVDLKGYTVPELAADINDVRHALGYKKIILWGGSFGSHWGIAIMRYYPKIVERAILRGLEGPNHTYDHPGHYWNIFKRVAQEAEMAPELKGFIPKDGLLKAIEIVVERVSKNPFTITVTDTNGSQDVLFDGQSIKRFADGYSGGLPGWPANVIEMYYGSFQEAAEIAVRRNKNSGKRYSTASFWMLDCGSGITTQRLSEYRADPAQEIVGSTYWSYAAGCSVWNSDLGDDFRANFTTDIPTVLVHGTWDTSTPFENVLDLAPYFKNSKLIPVIRGPHGAIRAAFGVSEEFKNGIMQFAETGNISELPDKVEMPPVEWIVPRQRKESN